jgi:hypothetical protein
MLLKIHRAAITLRKETRIRAEQTLPQSQAMVKDETDTATVLFQSGSKWNTVKQCETPFPRRSVWISSSWRIAAQRYQRKRISKSGCMTLAISGGIPRGCEGGMLPLGKPPAWKGRRIRHKLSHSWSFGSVADVCCRSWLPIYCAAASSRIVYRASGCQR